MEWEKTFTLPPDGTRGNLMRVTIAIGLVFALIHVFLPSDAYLKNLFSSNKVFIDSLPRSQSLSSTRFSDGLRKCRNRYIFPQKIDPEHRQENPRYHIYTNDTSTLGTNFSFVIKNATVLDGDGILRDGPADVYIDKGMIYGVVDSGSKISQFLMESVKPHDIIDAKGKYVTPGLVEMHSHVGICTQPELRGVNDMFELMNPTTQFTKTLDAFNIGDPAIKLISYGGVTSSLVLPSANLISGEGFVFKMLVPPSRSVEEMLLQYDPNDVSPNLSVNRQRWMKMACGENPKKRFVANPSAPKSRMGLGFLFRSTMEKAQHLKEEQDLWCDAIEQGLTPKTPSFPENSEYDLLVELLRGKVRTNSHCYETFDIETLFRHAREFGFNITAVHHALDAYKIPEIIKRQPGNVSIVTFATEWGFKKEAFQGSVFSPKILNDNNITIALHTDHPANGGQDLIIQAQIAHSFGLPADKAFSAISGTAAKILGLDDRIGYLRKGYDADLVLWDRHPLQAGSSPLKVYIDGVSVLNVPIPDENKDDDLISLPGSLEDITTDKKALRCLEGSQEFVVKGIKQSFLKSLPSGASNITKEMVVKGGEVLCFQQDCSEFYSAIHSNCMKIITLKDGYVVPAGTALTTTHGITEMPSELSTGDGDVMDFVNNNILDDFSDPEKVVAAKNGLHLESKHLKWAHNSGVLKIITPPLRNEGKKFLTGISTAFRSDATDLNGIIKENVAIHFTIGDLGKQILLPTVSLQIQTLRKLLLENKGKANAYGDAFRGELPIALHTNSKDVILQLIKLKNELKTPYFIIVGGVEAHLVGKQLAENGIPVVLEPWRCQRKYWDERRCLTGLHGTPTAITALKKAGVKFAIAVDEDKLVRLLYQEATIAKARSDITSYEALKAISYDVEDIFKINDFINSLDFLVTEGHPLTYGSQIVAIVENGTLTDVYPDLEPEFEVSPTY